MREYVAIAAYNFNGGLYSANPALHVHVFGQIAVR
jgi:hypothetical protein